jgi:hypothetical protein
VTGGVSIECGRSGRGVLRVGRIMKERAFAISRVIAGCVTEERKRTDGCVRFAGRIGGECTAASAGVMATGSVINERVSPDGCVVAALTSQLLMSSDLHPPKPM